ncbi:hypothetical protein DM860_002745 [Cuscuta australis]|uniref:Malectin-like domain-containing protein n=1 Tax=Cuscuta australis TaxID=267555 RepID=A0A328D0E0_9ASTE|nr:hypothetical protein DM860_002745 [Cuscuta australis]
MGLLGGQWIALLIWVLWLPQLGRTQPSASARALDSLLQDYAFRDAFGPRPKTGVVYDGTVPSNLTGIKVSALRLRSGSLRRRNITFKEFQMPVGVIGYPYVVRLALVYQNLGNWSVKCYPLSSGYIYLSPVLGLLAYDAANLSATNLPELNITATGQPISISFPKMKSVPGKSIPKCVSIDLNGSVSFSNVLSGNICNTFKQGHFSIVVESIAPSPAPMSSSSSPMPPPEGAPPKQAKQAPGHNKTRKVGIIVGSVVGGLVVLVLLGALTAWACSYKRKKKMQEMEMASEVGEGLHMVRAGNTKAPAAAVTRTQPILETEYVP